MKKYSVPQTTNMEVELARIVCDTGGGGPEAPARQRVSNRFTV